MKIIAFRLFIFFSLLSFVSCEDKYESSEIEDMAQLSCDRSQECLEAELFQDTYDSYDDCIDVYEEMMLSQQEQLADLNADSCWDFFVDNFQCALELSCEDLENNTGQFCTEETTEYQECISAATSK